MLEADSDSELELFGSPESPPAASNLADSDYDTDYEIEESDQEQPVGQNSDTSSDESECAFQKVITVYIHS